MHHASTTCAKYVHACYTSVEKMAGVNPRQNSYWTYVSKTFCTFRRYQLLIFAPVNNAVAICLGYTLKIESSACWKRSSWYLLHCHDSSKRGSLPYGKVVKMSPPLSGLCTKKGKLQFVAGSFDENTNMSWRTTGIQSWPHDLCCKLAKTSGNQSNVPWQWQLEQCHLDWWIICATEKALPNNESEDWQRKIFLSQQPSMP